MYNQYLPSGLSFNRISEEESTQTAKDLLGAAIHASTQSVQESFQESAAAAAQEAMQEGVKAVTAKKNAGLTGILENLGLGKLMQGDIMLLLVLLLVLQDGGNMDILLALLCLLLLDSGAKGSTSV